MVVGGDWLEVILLRLYSPFFERPLDDLAVAPNRSRLQAVPKIEIQRTAAFHLYCSFKLLRDLVVNSRISKEICSSHDLKFEYF
jgi:hypothetical protein